MAFDGAVTLCNAFAGGRVLFAGTDTGCIRAYKYPLNGEFQEFRCCGSAITQLTLSHDDAVLFASGQDGSLFVFDVKDKDPTRIVTKRSASCKLVNAGFIRLFSVWSTMICSWIAVTGLFAVTMRVGTHCD